MKIIVSFTSYPPRINSVHQVVESLQRQTVQADEIVLYLSLDEFPDMDVALPEALKGMIGQKGFRIAWVHGNLKSHKKYYYALQEYKDAVVITVDDDKIYAQTMIEDLIKSYKRFPDAVSARVVRIMLKEAERLEPYHRWENGKYLEEYIDMPRMDLCAIGVGGICYPTALVNEDWFREKLIMEMGGNCDDLWLNYNEIINNIPVVYVKPSQEDITIENSQIYRLAANNLYGDGNDRCIERLRLLFKNRNDSCYQKWFGNLLTMEAYVAEKKKYYMGLFGGELDKVGNMPVYLYGAGRIAGLYLRILADLGLLSKITAIIVSEKEGNPSNLYDLQVRALAELEPDKEFSVILGVSEANKREIKIKLLDYNYINIELDMRIIMRYYPC